MKAYWIAFEAPSEREIELFRHALDVSSIEVDFIHYLKDVGDHSLSAYMLKQLMSPDDIIVADIGYSEIELACDNVPYYGFSRIADIRVKTVYHFNGDTVNAVWNAPPWGTPSVQFINHEREEEEFIAWYPWLGRWTAAGVGNTRKEAVLELDVATDFMMHAIADELHLNWDRITPQALKDIVIQHVRN